LKLPKAKVHLNYVQNNFLRRREQIPFPLVKPVNQWCIRQYTERINALCG